jgi:hypothetical protein
MAVLTVSSTANDGAGSLRQAIASAKAGDTIQFSPELANQKITLQRGYQIDKNITIDGANAPGLTLDGNQKIIVFQIEGEGQALQMTLSAIKIPLL